mgnify:CR=1 FL=1
MRQHGIYGRNKVVDIRKRIVIFPITTIPNPFDRKLLSFGIIDSHDSKTSFRAFVKNVNFRRIELDVISMFYVCPRGKDFKFTLLVFEVGTNRMKI